MNTDTQDDSGTVLVTGATGFVGAKLIHALPNSVALSRNQSNAAAKLGVSTERVIQWDASSPLAENALSDAPSAVVNLMGESIAHGRWTEAKKQRIRDSRILGTRFLVDSLIEQQRLPRVFVSASAIGFYGDSGEAEATEAYQAGEGFLTDVCRDWEQEALRLTEHGVRVALLRIGLVLGKEGGAFKEMAPIFRWGMGGNLGSGRQWMSWIHVDDLVAMIEFCLNHPIDGPVNATAPNPVRNATFTQAMAKTLGRFAILPAPKFMVKLALGEFADSLFFSQRIIPAKALEAGFEFQFDQIDAALRDIAN